MAGMVIVDCDAAFADAVKGEVVSRREMPIRCATGIAAGVDLIENSDPRIVLVDVGGAGSTSALRAVAHWVTRAAVMATAHRPSISLAVSSLKAGAREFVEKPCDPMAVALWALEVERPCPSVLAERLDMRLKECSSDPDVRLSVFSRQHRISASYTSKLFKRHVGVSFRRRLLEHRVSQAVELLTLTDDPICLVAEKCGFRANSRLSDAFKRIRGQSPKTCRYQFRQDVS